MGSLILSEEGMGVGQENVGNVGEEEEVGIGIVMQNVKKIVFKASQLKKEAINLKGKEGMRAFTGWFEE